MPKIKFLVSQISNKFFILSIFLSVLLFLILFRNNFNQALPQTALGASPDAVAIRVMPNPDHLSPRRWYQENIKVKGSPQALIVDGYEAVRDGRTVYVNAANVGASGSPLYTNIYIISYNQAAENATVDIFGQILEHWKFNANIPNQTDKDEVVRDTKRLADLADIKLALNNYQAGHNGTYPSLAAGSYLSGKSISTWPSWRQTLSTALGVTLPLDPVNKLGACTSPPGYATTTCWNQINKTFADPSPGNGDFNLPASSHAYVYTIGADGAYNICALVESGYSVTLPDACPDSVPGYGGSEQIFIPTVNCGGSSGVVAAPNAPFNGYVSLAGPSAARFTNWTITQIGSWSGWSSFLNLSNFNATTKKVTAAKTPATGQYSYKITVKNGPSGPLIASSTCNIRINCVPQCPFASDVDMGTTFTGPDGCGGRCNVVGTRCKITSWTPVVPRDTVCLDQPINEVSNCGNVQQTTGTKCCIADEPSCKDTQPANTQVVLGVCPGLQQCYICLPEPNQHYTWIGNSCVPKKRTFTCPNPSLPNVINVNATWNVVGSYQQTWSGSAWAPPSDTDVEYDITPSIDSCRFKCAYNYTWNGTNACIGVTQQANCSGTLPANASWNISPIYTQTWTGTSTGWQPPDNLAASHDDIAGTCKFNCNSSYVWQDPNCVPDCQSLPANQVVLSQGAGDNIVYDDNNSTTTAVNAAAGTFLKVGEVIPTPYIWVNNTAIDKVAKIRTFDGRKRDCVRVGGKVNCYWDNATWETMGQLIGTYAVGDDPARTSVNAETGDVWVGNRTGQSVTKLDINGVLKKTCAFAGIVRGLAIDKNGDVWVGIHNTSQVIKISGDDSSCVFLKTISVTPKTPYGLAMDSENNIWVANGSKDVTKITNPDSATPVVTTYITTSGSYGITVDKLDNVWLGGYPASASSYTLIKLPKGSSIPQYFAPSAAAGAGGLGVSLDKYGDVWVANYNSNLVIKVNYETGAVLGTYSSIGTSAHGMGGDSEGNVWVVNDYGSLPFNTAPGAANVRVFKPTGPFSSTDNVGNINPITSPGLFYAYKKTPFFPSDEPSNAYTYSDLTGLNRSLIFRTGTWESKSFPGSALKYWGNIEVASTIPLGTSVEVYIMASNNNASWNEYSAAEWNALPMFSPIRQALYIRIKVTLRSDRRGITPVISFPEPRLICP